MYLLRTACLCVCVWIISTVYFNIFRLLLLYAQVSVSSKAVMPTWGWSGFMRADLRGRLLMTLIDTALIKVISHGLCLSKLTFKTHPRENSSQVIRIYQLLSPFIETEFFFFYSIKKLFFFCFFVHIRGPLSCNQMFQKRFLTFKKWQEQMH